MRLISLGVAVLLAGCSTSPESPGPGTAEPTTTTPCVRFAGNLVTAITWNADERKAIVLALDQADGSAVIRSIDSESLAVEELARRSTGLPNAGLAMAGNSVSWSEVPASIWTYDGEVRRTIALHQPLYGLHATPSGFLGFEPDDKPGVVLAVADDRAVSERFRSEQTIESFDATPDGQDLVVAASNGPGTPVEFVVARGNTVRARLPISGRLVTNPVFRPGQDGFIYYEDHDTGSLKRIEIESGSTSVALSDDVAEPRPASDGRIAYSFASPGNADAVCFARLL